MCMSTDTCVETHDHAQILFIPRGDDTEDSAGGGPHPGNQSDCTCAVRFDVHLSSIGIADSTTACLARVYRRTGTCFWLWTRAF